MKIEYSLHQALPNLIVEHIDGQWVARIEFDWADSFNGTFWPDFLFDEDGKIEGEYADWLMAKGDLAKLGAAATHMEFPERIELGPIPASFIVDRGGFDEGEYTPHFSTQEKAESYAEQFGGELRLFDPQTITVEGAMEGARESVRIGEKW